MRARTRILILVIIMLGMTASVGGTAFFVLYRAAFEQQRIRLTEIVKSQARLMEAVARFDKKYSGEDIPGGAFAATLSQIKEAHSRLEGFAETGEFTLARREGEQIVFLLSHRRDELEESTPVPFSSELAEPMHLALSRESGGTVIGPDYQGETVLAAYEPVAVLDLGIVAKIDLAEIRKPFFKAGLLAGGTALVLISVGAFLFFRIGNPIIHELQESEERLNLALRSSGIGAWDWNIVENRHTWDDYTHPLFGLKPGVFSGGIEGFIDMLHPDDRERTKRAVARSVEEDAEYDTEYRVVWPDGSQHDLVTRGKVYRDRKGRAVRMTGVVWDITDRKRAEEQLRKHRELLEKEVERRTAELSETNQRLQREISDHKRAKQELEKSREELVRKTRLAAIGQISASMAHDLRNPLSSVRNATYYLERILSKEDPRVAEFLEVIDEEIRSADQIISSLLEMTRAREPTKQTVNLARLVTEVFNRTRKPGGIHCRIMTDPDPIEVSADPGQLRQLIGNLLQNAIDAMGGQGEFIVEAARSAAYDTIRIRDTGPGLARGVHENVFEPLVSTKAKGTGLGLTICRQIVERHRGTIDVVDHEGTGAAFEIRLPL